jgi:hypothetical protein
MEKKETVEKMIPLTIVKQKISMVLNDFAEQEMGNRITKYNIQGLANFMAAVFQRDENKEGDSSI